MYFTYLLQIAFFFCFVFMIDSGSRAPSSLGRGRPERHDVWNVSIYICMYVLLRKEHFEYCTYVEYIPKVFSSHRGKKSLQTSKYDYASFFLLHFCCRVLLSPKLDA